MAPAQAGSAYIPVRPDMSDFHKLIRKELEAALGPLITKIGQQIGEQLHEGINKGLGDPLTGPLEESTKRQRRQAPRDGEDLGGAFAGGFKKRVTEALRDLPKAEITADSSEADKKVAALRARMEELAKKTIGIDVEPGKALAEIAAIKAELDTLAKTSNIQVAADTAAASAKLAEIGAEAARVAAEHPDIKVDADTAKAIADLTATDAEVKKVDGKRAHVQVDVDVTGALSSLGMLAAKYGVLGSSLVGLGAAGGASLAALGAAAIGTGAGIGGMALVAAPAISRIKDALQAQTQASQQSAAASVQSQQRVLAEAGAREQLAAAIRNEAQVHQQALDQVRTAEQQYTQAQVAAADAARALTQARLEARRAAEDLKNQVIDAGLAVEEDKLQVDAARSSLTQMATAAQAAAQQVAQAQAQLNAALQAQQQINGNPGSTDIDKAAAQARVNAAKAAVTAAQAQQKAADRAAKQADLNYRQAVQRLKEQQLQLKRLQEDERAAAKAGVDGSNQVRQAREQLTQANLQVENSERSLAQARAGVARADQQAADQVAAARRAMISASLQGAAANSALAFAMGKLSPAARQLMVAWQGFAKVYQAWQAGLEPTVLPVLARGLDLLKGVFPLLTPAVRGAATALDSLLGSAKAALGSPFWQTFATTVGGLAHGTIATLGPALGNIATGLAGIIQAAAPFAPLLLGPLAQIAAAFGTFGKNALAFQPVIGQLVGGIGRILTGLQPALGALLGGIGRIAAPVVNALAQVAGALGTALVPVFHALAPLINQLVAALAPLLVQLVSGLSPILVALAPVLGAVIHALAPVISALLSGLKPVLLAIVPVVGLLVGALGQILDALAPILPVLGGFIASLLSGLMPILRPILTLIARLAAQLAGALIATLRAALPSVQQIVVAIASLLPTLLPLIPLWVQWEMAMMPLLPPILRLAAILVQLLVPILRVVITVLVAVVVAIMNRVIPVIRWLVSIITWAVNLIHAVFKWLYDELIGHSIIPDLVRGIQLWFNILAGVFRWIYNVVIRPVVNSIGSVIGFVWAHTIKPVFDAIRSGISRVADSFKTGAQAISANWDKIKGYAAAPVRFVIDRVINHGILWAWDTVAKWLHLPGGLQIPYLPLPFADGGIVQYYANGGMESHTAQIAPAGAMRVWAEPETGGEAYIPLAQAKRGRSTEILGAVADHFGYGLVPFANGGFWGSVGRVASGILGKGLSFAKGALDAITDPGKWIAGHLTAPVKKLLGQVDGTNFGKASVAIGERSLSAMADALKKLLGMFAGGGGAQAMVSLALQQVGTRENPPGSNNQPYSRGLGRPAEAWCADFVDWLAKKTGQSSAIPQTASAPGMARGFGSRFRSGSSGIQAGDIVFFDEGQGSIVHTGIAVSANTNGSWTSVEGNYGDRVVKQSRSQAAGYAHPAYTGGAGGAVAGGSLIHPSPSAAQAWARQALVGYGWQSQSSDLIRLWNRESGWRWNAQNPSSGAYGIPQSLPASKMASAGPDWHDNAATQIKWGLGYIRGRYGSPSRAWSHEVSSGWYDDGGWLQPGLNLAYNASRKPEPVFSHAQWGDIASLARGGDGASQVAYNIYPQRADLSIHDLEALQRRQEALARVRRPR